MTKKNIYQLLVEVYHGGQHAPEVPNPFLFDFPLKIGINDVSHDKKILMNILTYSFWSPSSTSTMVSMLKKIHFLWKIHIGT